MMSQVEIDVSQHSTNKLSMAKLIVAALLVVGVTLSAMGVSRTSARNTHETNPTVSWHNVSDTLHQVELAKADLFDTLRDKSR